MKAFLGVSVAPHAPDRLRRPVRAALACLGAEASATVEECGDGWLAFAGADLAALLPPFAAAHRDGPGAPVVVAGDWLGFRQLYAWSGDGVAAVSTSARALAVLAGGGFDPVGLAAQAMIGWQVSDTTIF